MQNKKRFAVITGASSGIGKAFAYQLAANGYDLILIARRKNLLDRIAGDLQKTFKNAVVVYKADLVSEEQRKKLCEWLTYKYKSIDLLINNAGFGKFGKSSEIGAEEASKMIKVNVMALTDLNLSLLPQILRSKEKSIINVASVASFHPSIYSGVYAATKAYVYSFSMALATEYEGKLRILTLCPGLTATEFWDAAGVASPHRFVYSPEVVVKKALKSLGKKKLLIIGYENHLRIFLQKIISDELVLKLTHKIYSLKKK
jgi:uncharacterized protein